ncbi:FAD-dependent oxidoreductase [Bradyrhizobium prioriisuperbiae]|uniref:NAD(P)/FAD-dependent oxidoreductase n=1 Tax=Bradyrhizobium prioriisuperbiae TaxID=2854389 RepID=UPI0028E5612C|nr:FAD-dependent oxidoreductase [Bradyrhizobium prioritasuperba]
MPSAIVLGAGMAGVAAALQLQSRGWSVALVDRQAPGRATSYGNAGFIQSEAVEPYPMPRDLASLIAIATGRSNDVHYNLATLPRHIGSLLQYWWFSAPQRYAAIVSAYAGIIAHAAPEHETLMNASGVANLVRRDGFRILLRSQATMDFVAARAERLRVKHGVRSRLLSAAELAQAEPGLRDTGIGALHWLDTWTAKDPGGVVGAYADLFVRSGGNFVHGDAASLRPSPGGGWSVATENGTIAAEHAVVALGPWSPELLRKFGYRFPMVRKRGYHRHFRGGTGLDLPLMDSGFGYVLAPMAMGLRITTGAELTGPGASMRPVQLGRAEQAARGLLDLGTPVEQQPWSGTRPCMPDMLPVVGPASRHAGLWMHFGHGHQGFTLGPATGRLLAEMMVGETPFVDPAPFRPDRY